MLCSVGQRAESNSRAKLAKYASLFWHTCKYVRVQGQNVKLQWLETTTSCFQGKRSAGLGLIRVIMRMYCRGHEQMIYLFLTKDKKVHEYTYYISAQFYFVINTLILKSFFFIAPSFLVYTCVLFFQECCPSF